MKHSKSLALLGVFAVFVSTLLIGCASEPKLGSPTELQQILNALPEISVAGKNVKIEFGGDTWIARESGKNVLAGSFTSEDTADGSILTLKQTHVYSDEQKPGIGGDVGWVKTPGPNITLEYKKGPPAALTTK
jgi:hypothetical protein